MNNYMSARQISEKYDYCMKTVRNLISEIRDQVNAGRYPKTAVLDGCGIRLNEDVLIDYLAYRKMLKDPVAAQYVEAYKGAEE